MRVYCSETRRMGLENELVLIPLPPPPLSFSLKKKEYQSYSISILSTTQEDNEGREITRGD